MKRFVRFPVLPLAVLLGGFALRLYHLGAESLWYDETVSLALARSDLAELTRHTAADIHPPLYYYLLHFWGQVAGWSEFSSAFLSLAFGVLLVAAVWRVAREFSWPPGQPGGTERARRVALLAALLVAASPYNVWYSQEVRMYTLGALLGLASAYFLWRMLRVREPLSPSVWLAYVVTTVLGIYTLYYFIFLIVFEYLATAIWFLNARPRSAVRRPLGFFIGSQLAVVLLYLPWLPIAFHQAADPPVPPWRSFTGPWDVLVNSWSALLLGESVTPAAVAPLLLLALLPIGYVLVRAVRSSSQAPGAARVAALLGYTLVPVLAIFAASLRTPLYHPRYVFTYSPAFYILLALGMDATASGLARTRSSVRGAVTATALAVWLLAAGYSLNNFWFDPHYGEDDLRGAVARIAENWRSGDVILVNAGYVYTALDYYYPGPIQARVRLSDYWPQPRDAAQAPLVLQAGSIGGGERLGWGDPRSDFYSTTAGATRAALDRVYQSHPRLWLLRLYDTVTDPNGVIRQYLADHGRLIDDAALAGQSGLRVQAYLTQLPASLPAEASRIDAQLAGRVTLLGYVRTWTRRESAGYLLDEQLYWQPLQSLNFNYQMSLQLLNQDGKVVVQRDERPLGDALPTSRWKAGEIYPEPVRLEVGPLPPGAYRVIVKLYNLESGEVLGEPIQLETFHPGP